MYNYIIPPRSPIHIAKKIYAKQHLCRVFRISLFYQLEKEKKTFNLQFQ